MLDSLKFLKLGNYIAKFFLDFHRKLNINNSFYLQYKVLIISSQSMFVLLFIYFIIDLICNFDNPPNIIALSAIGILLSAFLTITNHFYNKEEVENKKEEDSKIELDNFLSSIREELTVLWNTYYENIGSKLEEQINSSQRNSFDWFYPIDGNYFNIYDSNTNLLVKIEDSETREKLIEVYIRAKGLVDSYKFNNMLLEKLESFPQGSMPATQYHSMLIDYADVLIKSHNDIKSLLIELEIFKG